jgi:hypothetical protein
VSVGAGDGVASVEGVGSAVGVAEALGAAEGEADAGAELAGAELGEAGPADGDAAVRAGAGAEAGSSRVTRVAATGPPAPPIASRRGTGAAAGGGALRTTAPGRGTSTGDGADSACCARPIVAPAQTAPTTPRTVVRGVKGGRGTSQVCPPAGDRHLSAPSHSAT